MSLNIETYALAKKNTKKQIEEAISSVYTYKGSVNSIEDLPSTGNKIGDTYNIINEGGQNYAWDGIAWDPLGVNQDATTTEKGLVKLGSKTDIENGVTNKAATPAAIKDFVKENAPKIWYDYLTQNANPSPDIQNFEDIKIGDFFYNLDSQGGIYDLFICTIINRQNIGNELVWSKINYKTATSQDINNLFTNPLQDAENVNF